MWLIANAWIPVAVYQIVRPARTGPAAATTPEGGQGVRPRSRL